MNARVPDAQGRSGGRAGLCLALVALVVGLATETGRHRPAPSAVALPLGAASDQLEALLLGRRMDLRQADVDALRAVPGVGPGLAGRIVEFSSQEGPWSWSRLGQVPGLGPRRLEQLRRYADISP